MPIEWTAIPPLETIPDLMLSNQAAMLIGMGSLMLVSFAAQQLLRHRPPKLPGVHGSAAWSPEKAIDRAGLFDGPGVILGMYHRRHYNLYDERCIIRRGGEGSTLFVGAQGTGKSVAGICTARSWQGDLFCIDLNGQLLRETAAYRPGDVYVWDPTDAQGAGINPLDLWRDDDRMVIDAQRFAAHLAETEPGEESSASQYYKRESRAGLTMGGLFVKTEDDFEASPEGLYDLFTMTTAPQIVPLLNRMQQSPIKAVRRRATVMLRYTPQKREDIWNAVASWLIPWDDPTLCKVTSKTTIPFHLLQVGPDPLSLYLRLTPEDVQGRLRPVVRLLVDQVLMWIKDRRPDAYLREMLALFDDMAELGHLKAVPRIPAHDRKYGFRLMGLIQDIEQIREVFGPHTSLMNLFQSVVVYAPNSPETARYISEGKIGYTTVSQPVRRTMRKQLAFLRSHSDGELEVKRLLMDATELQKLLPNEVLIFTKGVHDDDPALTIRARAIRYFDHPVFA